LDQSDHRGGTDRSGHSALADGGCLPARGAPFSALRHRSRCDPLHDHGRAQLHPGGRTGCGGRRDSIPLALLRPLAAFAATAAALVGASYIGFFPAMAVLLVLLWPILQVQNWEKYSIACILLLGFVYVVFVMILGVPLTSLRLMSM
jgi:hypothetical protein